MPTVMLLVHLSGVPAATVLSFTSLQRAATAYGLIAAAVANSGTTSVSITDDLSVTLSTTNKQITKYVVVGMNAAQLQARLVTED